MILNPKIIQLIKMKSVSDILSEEQIKRYRKDWREFKGKYILNSSKNVHSGMPVISEVYQFENYPVFRAHVFGRRMRKFDPYFIASQHPMPFWNAQHYLMVGEQMYSAVSHLVIGPEYNKRVAKEVPIEFNWKKPVFFIDNISVELIRFEEGKSRKYNKETGYFTIYSDKNGRLLSKMSALSFWQPRAYLQDIEKIMQGDNSAIDDLIRKIEAQANNHRRMRKPRITLKSSQSDLVEALKEGHVPEEELHDFFSFWE